jgi:hypothetical protein
MSQEIVALPLGTAPVPVSQERSGSFAQVPRGLTPAIPQFGPRGAVFQPERMSE